MKNNALQRKYRLNLFKGIATYKIIFAQAQPQLSCSFLCVPTPSSSYHHRIFLGTRADIVPLKTKYAEKIEVSNEEMKEISVWCLDRKVCGV